MSAGDHDARPRLSPRVQEVLTLAHELGRRESGIEPHSGHVLIGLIRAGGPVVEDTLRCLSVSYEDVLAAIAAAGSTPDSKLEMARSLAAAERIAVEDGQVYVDAPSLLVGLLDDPDNVAARALASLGVTRAELARYAGANRDMLVPLLALPDPRAAVERAAAAGVRVRRARAWEAPALRTFIAAQGFSRTWGPEATNGFARQPISVFLAERDRWIVGFAAYDCGRRGIFGPTGVAQKERAAGVASALLLRTLEDMRTVGYVYAIIGATGPAEFYERVCGAVLLPGDWPSYVESMD